MPLKSIGFNFPIYIDGKEGKFSLSNNGKVGGNKDG